MTARVVVGAIDGRIVLEVGDDSGALATRVTVAPDEARAVAKLLAEHADLASAQEGSAPAL